MSSVGYINNERTGLLTIVAEDVPQDCKAILRRTLWIKTELVKTPNGVVADSFPVYAGHTPREAKAEPIHYIPVDLGYLEEVMEDSHRQPEAPAFADLLEEEVGYFGIRLTGRNVPVQLSQTNAAYYLQAYAAFV